MKLCLKYHQGLYTWTRALRTLFEYTEFTKKKDFEQLTVAVSAGILTVKNSRSPNVNEPNFSTASYMILFQIQGQYWFSLTTKQQIIREFIWN